MVGIKTDVRALSIQKAKGCVKNKSEWESDKSKPK